MKLRSPKKRWLRRLLVVASALILVFAVATARIIIWPTQGMPAHVDVIAMPDGPGDRLDMAEQLAREGRAPVLVVSQGHGGYDPCPSPIPGTRIICFTPNPANTRGEAEYIAGLARKYHWQSVVLVTSREQASRARLLMSRCYTGSIYVVTVAQPWYDWPYQIAYGWGSLFKAEFLQRTC